MCEYWIWSCVLLSQPALYCRSVTSLLDLHYYQFELWGTSPCLLLHWTLCGGFLFYSFLALLLKATPVSLMKTSKFDYMGIWQQPISFSCITLVTCISVVTSKCCLWIQHIFLRSSRYIWSDPCFHIFMPVGDVCATYRPCSDICTNVNGGYRCSCRPGRRLNSDRRTCCKYVYCWCYMCHHIYLGN